MDRSKPSVFHFELRKYYSLLLRSIRIRRRNRMLMVCLLVLVNFLVYFTTGQIMIWSASSNEIETLPKVESAREASVLARRPPVLSSIFALKAKMGMRKAEWMDWKIVRDFPMSFVHNHPRACRTSKGVELLVVVTTARRNWEKRQAVRDTWGRQALKSQGNNVVMIFFMGNALEGEDPDVQRTIDAEAATYRDIIQGRFNTTDERQSLNSLWILKWIDAYCTHANFMAKTDDDIYMRIPEHVEMLRRTRESMPTEPFILGDLVRGAAPVRDKSSKWYISEEVFPNSVYPAYVSGSCYSMAGHTASLLLHVALRNNGAFLGEDIFITGRCAKTGEVLLIQDDKVSKWKKKLDGCDFKNYNIGHGYSIEEMYQIHKDIKNNVTCN